MRRDAGFLVSPIFVLVCRLVIGVLLLLAGLAKIGDPASFARQVENFDMLPLGWENLVAIAVPWIEVVAGLALIVGFCARSAAWLALAMLVVFDVAVLQAVARGLNFECGCFGTASGTRVGLSKLAENLVLTGIAALGSLRLR